MNNLEQRIKQFLSSSAFGVVGASNNRAKYGNKVLRCYLQHHKTVYPVHPKEKTIEGIPCVAEIRNLPKEVKSISIITPPPITEKIVEQAIQQGIENIWMQPGAESPSAIKQCEQHNINWIANGPCILVTLGFHETTKTSLQDIYNEWQNNLAFRQSLTKNPEQALKDAGFEVSAEDLEKIKAKLKFDKSKNEKLDDRISK